MAQKKMPEASSAVRRKSLEADVASFLAAGNKIEKVPSGVSSQDSAARGKHIRLGPPKDEKASNDKGKTEASDK